MVNLHDEYSAERSHLPNLQQSPMQSIQPPAHQRSVSVHEDFNTKRPQANFRIAERSKSVPKIFDRKALAEIFNLLDEQGQGSLTSCNFEYGNLSGEDLKYLEPVILKILTCNRAKKFKFVEFSQLCKKLCN